MCDVCADGPVDPFPDNPTDVERLWHLARALEAALPGMPAPADAWDIFRGRRSGPLEFSIVERLASSFLAARRAHVAPDPLGF